MSPDTNGDLKIAIWGCFVMIPSIMTISSDWILIWELPEYSKVHQHVKMGVLSYLSRSIIISWEGYGVHILDKLSGVSV
jgi:hypothetical protein